MAQVEVKFGVRQKVFVTDISDTGKIFVQLDTPEAYQLPELSEAIGHDVHSHLSSPVNPTLGLKCFAHSPVHQTWYRAIVTDIKGVQVTVFYVDYGNSEVVPAAQVHAPSVGGSADQYDFLYQALCCTLSDFIPEQGQLSPHMVSVLRMLLTNQEFAAVFQSRNLSESHPYVPSFPCYNLTLFKTDSSEESVAQELVSNRLGRYSICADSVEVASTAEVFTCFVDSPEKFWVQFSDKFQSLEAIMDTIAEPEVLSTLKPLPSDAMFPGVACCCQFSVDGMFYRAKIIRVSATEVEVCFIDYGNSEIVSPDAILELPSRLVLTPACALQCCLDGVRPVGEDWTGEACDKFVEISDGRELKGTFVSQVSPDVFSVQLQDGSTGDQLGQTLIDCGVAAPSEAVSTLIAALSETVLTLPASSPEFQYLSLEVGQKHNIFVTFVESPSVVWCQCSDFATKFDHVMSGLSEKGPGMPPMTHPAVDEACCVLYHIDQTWCRGSIQSVDTTSSTAEVLFVDFGNTEHIKLSDLRQLDSVFFSLPAQAISFSMCEISPQTGEAWSAEAIAKFQDLTLEKELICDVVGLDKDGYPSAKLLDPTQGDKDIGRELARLGYAKSPFLSPMKPPRDERRTPFKSYSQQSRNSSSQSSQKSSPFQSQKSSPYHSERSSPFRSQKPRGESYRDTEKRSASYDKGSPDMAGGMRSQVLYSYSKVKIMNAQSYYVAVSYVKDLEEFYCQLQSSAADLETLMNDIDTHCASSEATPVSSPHKDMPVIAQYSEDQGWYRALINATPSRDQCQVTFIDYGNSENVPLANVLEIPPQFFHLPAQAFKCALYGVPRDFTPTQQVIEAFTELTLEQNLHCFVKVIPKGKVLCVIELTLSDKTKVVEKLRQDGHLPAHTPYRESPRQRDFSQSPRQRDFSQSPGQQGFSQSPRQRDFSQSPRRDYSQSSRQQDYSQSSRQRDYSQSSRQRDYSQSSRQQDYSQSSRQRDYSQSSRQQDYSQSSLQQDYSQSSRQQDYSQSSRQCDYSQQPQQQEFSLQKDFPELPRRQESPKASRKKEDTVQRSVPLPQLPTNTHLDVYISFTESPAQFYIQLAESYTTLEQLSTLLEESCARSPVGGGVRPEVGTFCAAQFSEDKLWYRARVTAVHGSEVEVCFIDYGNSERVQASELKPLQPQCAKLPCSAVPCTLHGLDPAVAKSPEAIQKFSSLTTDRKLVVEFLKPFSSYDSIVPVQLHDTSQPGLDLDITDCLHSQAGTGMGPTKAQTPVLNSSLDCSVVFAVNPGEFYCQLNSASEAIDVLMDSMYMFYAEEGKGSVIANPTVGSYCAAPFSDGSWYRGKLVHVTPDIASIFYVDYGNTEDVPRSDVRTLESQFCALPAQALRCSLEGVSPLAAGGWSPECITKFQEAVLEQEVKGTFLRASGAGFYVQLEFKGQVISQKLIEAGLAKKKEVSIPPFIVQPGETYRVIVTTVTSPQEFYSQILDEEGKLDILMGQIEDHCTNLPSSTSPISWEAGNSVLAQFTEDQGWYRAVINKIVKDKNVAEVQYIDYGNIEVLPVPELRPIPPEFCALPHQAVRCCLEGAQFYTYNQDSLAAFTKLLLNNEFQMKCVSMVTNHCAVDLKRLGDGLDLMSYAIQQKIVEPRSVDSMLLPSPHNLQKSPGTNRAVKIITQFPEVEPDSFHDVLVSHVESPNLFYCQFSLHMQDHLDTLMNQLQDVCTTEHDSRPKVECSKGDFIAAQFSGDELWYRAQVCDTTVEGVAVCFVDHGNQEVVSHSQIQYLDPEFAKLPAQAVPCSLAEVLPSGGADWTNESVEKFTDMVVEKQFVAQVKLASTSKLKFSFGDGQTLAVALIEEESPISEELVRMGYAKQASTTPLEAEVSEAAAKKPVLTQCTLEDSVPITVGARHEVFVSHVESPSSFWLQLASSDETLNTLAEKLEATYSSGTATLTLVDPAAGMQCCTKFSEDEHWYRGIVQSVDPTGVDIRFVDYGNSEVVNPKDIKVLSPEFANLPAQSIKCELLNCRPPAHSDWSENEVAAFSELVVDKSLYAEFVSHDGRSWQVRLWEGETDIAKQLTAVGRVGSEKTDDCKISELQLNMGETYSVYVAVPISPTEFYVQLSSQCDELEALMALVADYYNGHQPVAILQVGSCCVAQYSENNAWYRAQMVQIESENSVNVRFVDYGNCESVSSNQILALTDKLSQLPAQAICCSLTANLTEQFSDDKLEEFFSLDFENEFKIRVCGEESGRYIVQLLHKDATPISDTLLSPSIETCAKNQQSLTSLNYNVGSRVDVYLSHIDSPTSFYCQPLELTGELDTMMTKLASTMAESHPEPVQTVVVGQICLARFQEDGEWYRAIVNSVTSDEELQVTFVDYGNSEWTSRDHLAALPKEFLSTQVQAVHCSVFETMSSKVKWPQEKVEEFQNLIPESEHCTLTVTGVSESGQLFVEIETSGEKLNFAGLLEDLAQRPTSLPVEELLVHQMSNVSIHETEISTLAVKGSKTPSTELETESESGVEGEPLIRAPFKLSLAVQEEFEASVVHVHSPSLLFIQRLDCRPELNALSTEIEQYCAGFAGKPFQEAFRKGDFVLARYSLNELWHRAQVLEVDADSSAKVSFIDFGNTETISCESMTMCPENFLELPVQAIPCSLAQVPHRECWPPNYKDLIQSLVQDRVVKVGVVIPASQGMRSTITLSDLESGMNIAQPVLDQLQQECEEGAFGDVLMEVAEESAGVQKTVLPEHSFEIGCSYEVYLVSCTSPHSFICQLANDDVLESLTAQLAQEYLSDNECHTLLTTPEEGDAMCCQFSEDEQWYRARVLSVEGGECEVLFVDFGNTEVVPVTKLRTLVKALCSHPPLTFECFLSGIESPARDRNFDELASEKMLKLVGEDSATLEVHSVDTGGHLSVTMTTSQGVDISAALIEAGLATLLVPTPLTTPSTVTLPGSQSTTDQTPMTGEGGVPLEAETPMRADLEEPIPEPEYVPLPESDTNEEEEEEEEEEEKEEEKEDEEEKKKREGDEAESAMAYPSQLLEAGTKLHVVVSSTPSMEDFVCQITGENAALRELMDSITARGYTVGDHRLALQEPKLGLPVCACSTKDEAWYRGEITSTKNLPKLVTIRYIDYGNSEELAVERIKRLEKHFADLLPPQTFTCSFPPLCERDLHPDVPDELEPWELVWPLSCVQQFSEIVLGRELSLEVVDVVERGTLVVRLVDLSSGDDVREVIVRTLREPKFLQLNVPDDKEEEDGEFHDALDAENDVKMAPVSGKPLVEETTEDLREQVGTEREGEKKSGDLEENLESEEEEEEWSDAREDGNSQVASEGTTDHQEAKGTEEEEGEEEGEERKEEREEEGKKEKEEVLREQVEQGHVEQQAREESEEDVGMGEEEDREKEQRVEDEGIPLAPAQTQSESVEDVETADQVGSVPAHPMEGGEDGSVPGTPVKPSDSTSFEGEGGEIELSVTKEEEGEDDGSSLDAPLTGMRPPDDPSMGEEKQKLENGEIEQLVNEEEKEEDDRSFLDAPVSVSKDLDEPLPGEGKERFREGRDPVEGEGEGEGGGDGTEGDEGEDGSTPVTSTRPQESVDQEEEEGEDGSSPVTATRPQESVDQEEEEGEDGSSPVTATRPQESVDQEEEEGEEGSSPVTSTRPQESVDQEEEEGEDGSSPVTSTRPQESVDQEEEEGEDGSSPVTSTRPQESVDQEEEEGEDGSSPVTATRPQESVDQEEEEGEDGSSPVTSTRPQESVDQEEEEGEDGSTPVTSTRPQESVDQKEEEGEDGSTLDTPLTVTRPPNGTLAGEEEKLKGGKLDHPVNEEDGLSLDAPVTGGLDHSVEVDEEEEDDPTVEAERDHPVNEEEGSRTEPPDSSTVEEEDTGSKEKGGDDSPQVVPPTSTNQVEGGQPLNEDEGEEASVEPCRSADSLSGDRKGGEQVDRDEEEGDGLTAEAPARLPNSTLKEEDEREKGEDGGKERGREDNTGEGGGGEKGDVAPTISSEVQATSDVADLTSRLTQDDDDPTLSCETVADSSSQVDAVRLADEGIVCNGGVEKGEPLQYNDSPGYKELQFAPGQEMKLVYVSGDSPESFTCQPFDNHEQLKALKNSIKDYITSCEPDSSLVNLKPGEPIIVEECHRAEVIRVDELASKVEALLVDVGMSDRFSFSEVHRLPPSRFIELPKQAVRCRLSRMQPGSQEWPVEATQKFQELVTSADVLMATVVSMCEDIVEVRLQSSHCSDFAQELTGAGLTS